MDSEDDNEFVGIALDYARAAVADRRGKSFCKETRLAAKRYLADLKRAKRRDCEFYFSGWHAGDVCDFIEKLPHVQGSWDDPTLVLEPAQVFILVNVFGFRRRSDDRRRFTRAYIEVARKNAKSTLTAGVALYCLTCEGEMGPDIVVGATTGAQADKVFKPAKLMVERTSALREAFQLKPWARSITCAENGGSVQPINAKSSTQDGWNPYVAILDELHAHKDRGLFDVMRSAFGARKQPLMWMITTAGYDVRGVCYEQRTFLSKVLAGAIEADHYFGIIFTIDTEELRYELTGWQALDELEAQCSCNNVPPTLIEKFWQEACARHAMRPGAGRDHETRAAMAAISQSIEEDIAHRATRRGKRPDPEPLAESEPIPSHGPNEIATSATPEMPNGESETRTTLSGKTEKLSTASTSKSSKPCSPSKTVNAQYVKRLTKVYASIIATLQELSEDCFAETATAELAFSETLSNVYHAHSDTCSARKSELGDGFVAGRTAIDDPFDEAVWAKANPLLGTAVDLAEFRGYAIEAKESPASLGEFLTKRLNVWLNAASAWLSVEQWKRAGDPALTWSDFVGCECAVGADLADKDDITAVVLVGLHPDGRYLFKPVFFIPSAALVRETQSDTGQSTYGVWAGHNGGPPLGEWEGLPPLFAAKDDGQPDYDRPVAELPPAWQHDLLITPGDFVDHDTVEQLVRWFVATQSVRQVVFDQFAAAQLMASRLNSDLGTPDAPLASVLHKSAANVTNPAKELEVRVRAKDPAQHLCHDANPVLQWMVSNAVVTRHVNGTIIPKKESSDSQNKIDGVDAMINGIAHFVSVEAETGPAPIEFTGL